MLRSQISKIFTDEKIRKRVLRVLTCLSVLGFIWTLNISKLSEVFPNNDLGLKSVVKNHLPIAKGTAIFMRDKIQDGFGSLDSHSRIWALYEVIKEQLGYESYVLPYKDISGYEGINLISIIRSPKGMGNQ